MTAEQAVVGRASGERATSASGNRILLVEDSALDVAMIRTLLLMNRDVVEVHVARTLEEALDMLPAAIDLVLLDLGLPDGFGIEVVSAIVRKGAGVPIVVLTGADDLELARHCLQHGVQDYVLKKTLDERGLARTIEYARVREHVKRAQRAELSRGLRQQVASIAHEVNNPAAFIHLNTEELLYRVAALESSLESSEAAVEVTALRGWLSDLASILEANLGGIEQVSHHVKSLGPLSSRPRGENDEGHGVPVASERTRDPRYAGHRLRVMVIDDDAEVLAAVARRLERAYDVVAVGGVEQALSLLERGRAFDVIFCDLVMPDRDGVDFVRSVREDHPEHAQRVVILSGGAATERAMTFAQSTSLRVLFKPLPLNCLSRVIEDVASVTAMSGEESDAGSQAFESGPESGRAAAWRSPS